MTYDHAGRLIRRTDADGVTQLFAYNALGEQSMTAIDADRDGAIGLASADRVTLTSRGVVLVSGSLVAERTTTSVLPTVGSGSAVVLSTTDQTLNGHFTRTVAASGTTTTLITVDGTGGRTEILTRPDGVRTIRVYSQERLTSETVKDAANAQLSHTTLTYDAHGRLAQSIDARNGATLYTYTALDELHSVSAPPPATGQPRLVTHYQYDALGRRTVTTLPDGTQTTQLYWPTGELRSQSGSQTYPVTYTYDTQGRMKTMSTLGQSGTAVTTWNYNPQRGWLESKRYHDGQGPAYEYTPGGRLAKRTWARGVHTGYTYNTVGELIGTDYSDATPDVTIGYDRLGRRATVIDASGTTTFAYQGTTTLVTSGSITGGVLNGIVFTGTYDALQRRTGFSASHSSVPIVTQAYTYDAASRMATAAMGALSGSYAYHPNSSLVHTLTFKSGTTTVATTTKTFDALDRLTHIATVSANGTTAPVSHGYTLNALSQRTRVDLADGGYWIHGYNSRGEVISGIRHSSSGTPLPGQSFGYNFDDIGNRNFATVASGTTTYTANRLNQYTRITAPSGTATLQHDADGNLLNDGAWTYTWDAEHRLISATSGTTTVSFIYDAQSRRIAKTTATGTIRFLYDDWALVAEIDNTNSPIRRHLWGLDLSGSSQGAGGVGGLIATSLASGGAHFMAFDGNGNISAAINAADGSHSARFEYDPFGGTTTATGAAVPLLPFRFSTKYQDTETDLYYYGYRYYSPGAGRWLSRDPIEEEGGFNLCAFVYNNPNYWIDGLGARPMRPPPRPAPGPGMGDPSMTRPVRGRPGWTLHPIYGPMPPSLPNPNRPPTQPVIKAPDDTEGTQRPHSGEFHVQFGSEREAKIHSRTIWRRNLPLTKSEGTAKLDELWPKLTHNLQQRLRGSFDKAKQWIRARPDSGVDAFFVKDWQENRAGGRCWHLDLEVVSGKAFVSEGYQRLQNALRDLEPYYPPPDLAPNPNAPGLPGSPRR